MELQNSGILLPGDCWRNIVGYVRPTCTWIEEDSFTFNRRVRKEIEDVRKSYSVASVGSTGEVGSTGPAGEVGPTGDVGSAPIRINNTIIRPENIEEYVSIFTVKFPDSSTSLSFKFQRAKYPDVYTSKVDTFLKSIKEGKSCELKYWYSDSFIYDSRTRQFKTSDLKFSAEGYVLQKIIEWLQSTIDKTPPGWVIHQDY